MTQRATLLDEAVRLSQRMAGSSAAGDWQQVFELEAKRSSVLQEAFAQTAAPDTATTEKIAKILAADKRLMEHATTLRDEAAAELGKMQRGRKVKQAYQNASR